MMGRLSFLALCFIFMSCSGWKATLKADGDSDDAIVNSIIDFCHTSSLAKIDSTFEVTVQEIDSQIIAVELMGTINKIIVTQDGKNNPLPNKIYEYNNKLFYWYDPKIKPESDVVYKLHKYNLIDSLESIYHADLIIDDAKKSTDYYFCKTDLTKYKKSVTARAVGGYEVPKLICE